jgi:hypothetical protein
LQAYPHSPDIPPYETVTKETAKTPRTPRFHEQARNYLNSACVYTVFYFTPDSYLYHESRKLQRETSSMESIEHNEQEGRKHGKQDEQERNKQVGSLAGLGAGILAGARIGTAVIPIPVVGTFAGAMLGGVLGSAVGQRVGAATLSGINAFMDTLTAPPKREGDQSHHSHQEPPS